MSEPEPARCFRPDTTQRVVDPRWDPESYSFFTQGAREREEPK